MRGPPCEGPPARCACGRRRARHAERPPRQSNPSGRATPPAEQPPRLLLASASIGRLLSRILPEVKEFLLFFGVCFRLGSPPRHVLQKKTRLASDLLLQEKFYGKWSTKDTPGQRTTAPPASRRISKKGFPRSTKKTARNGPFRRAARQGYAPGPRLKAFPLLSRACRPCPSPSPALSPRR